MRNTKTQIELSSFFVATLFFHESGFDRASVPGIVATVCRVADIFAFSKISSVGIIVLTSNEETRKKENSRIMHVMNVFSVQQFLF